MSTILEQQRGSRESPHGQDPYQLPSNTTNRFWPLEHLKPSRVPNYIWCTLLTATGGFLFGFDTGSIGPITVMHQFQADLFPGKQLSPTAQGLIVSSILLTASVVSFISGPLSDRISRTRTIALGAVVFAAGSAISCGSGTLAQLFAGRCIAGIGEGLFLSVITVYTVEIAPASSRGRLGTLVQLLITIGLTSGFFICYATSRIEHSISWRLPLGMQAVVAASFAAGCAFLPHSPRWLCHVGRIEEARATWGRLGVRAADAEKTEETAQREEREREAEQAVHTGGWGGEMREMWKEGVRGRTVLGVFLFAMQQASGIDGVLYYAPVLFSQAGLSGNTASFISSGISGLVIVVFTIFSQFFADTWGRRPQTIYGGLAISLPMLIIGVLYATEASAHPAGRWAIVALIYVFVIGFTCGWSMVMRLVCCEIQPMRTRAAVTSLGQGANWVVNWLIAFSTPLFLSKSSYGPYFLFGCCSLLTTLVCATFQPETRGKSLEEVEDAFGDITNPLSRLTNHLSTFSISIPTTNMPHVSRLCTSRRHVHAGENEENEEELELDAIQLPQVPYGGPWHYAHRLADP